MTSAAPKIKYFDRNKNIVSYLLYTNELTDMI